MLSEFSLLLSELSGGSLGGLGLGHGCVSILLGKLSGGILGGLGLGHGCFSILLGKLSVCSRMLLEGVGSGSLVKRDSVCDKSK